MAVFRVFRRWNRTIDRLFLKQTLYPAELCETYQDVLPPVAPIPFEDQNTTRLIPFTLRRLIGRPFGQCARAHHPRNWQQPLAAKPRINFAFPLIIGFLRGRILGARLRHQAWRNLAFRIRLRWANHTHSNSGIEPSPQSTLTWTQNPPFYRDTRRCPLA